MEYTVFQTNFGWMAIVGSEHGLVSICLPLDSAQGALESQCEAIEYATFAPNRFKDLIIFRQCIEVFPYLLIRRCVRPL